MAAEGAQVPGWYGKIPALGDFASRRLPTFFITSWDAWLQRVLEGSRSTLGNAWLETYLHCPLWSFLLMPGVCGNKAWGGILMPSVDKVGRYFPLTVCGELQRLPASTEELGALLGWINQLEQPALAALETQHTVEQLEVELKPRFMDLFPEIEEKQRTTILRLARTADSVANDIIPITSATTTNIANIMSFSAAQALADAYFGKTLWWCHTDTTILFKCCSGLPDTDEFVCMLRGTEPAVE